MKDDDEIPPLRPRAPFELGQPADALSVADIEERLEILRAEIARLEAARAAKQAATAAAAAFFKK